MATVTGGQLDTTALEGQVRGQLISPEDSGYEEARQVYNAMIDKRPALIVRAADVADVIAVVNFARETGAPFAVRCGMHNPAGFSVVDDGIVLDLSLMKGIRVDPKEQLATVQGGCTWGDVDHATHAFGLAAPAGVISTTGMGLALGGGVGYLARQYGLSVDNLVSADVVLADGSFVTANEQENSDLFWALRGGGGNFGVVTSLAFRLHPVSTVIWGPMLWPLDRAAEVMRAWDGWIKDAPEHLNGFFAFVTVPPGPPFPEELHLQKMGGVVWFCTETQEVADELLAPARELQPALDLVGPVPYPAAQSAFDALYPPGHQQYWRADFIDELSDEAIETHVEYAGKLPTPQATMHLYPIDGAVHRVGSADTAFAYRNSRWAGVIVAVDPDPASADLLRSWVVDYWEATHPYSAGGAYVNFMMEEGQDRVQASYRDNYPSLAAIKKKFDPENVFRVNQNIKPAD
jgi:FAD binding domain-containing protein/berberine-like enzyme